MIRTRKQKIITLSLVFVAVITLTIGFAAFSNNLLIKSKLRVEATSTQFSVVFSSSASGVQTRNIVPVVSGSATAEEATIDNTSIPTLNNINATFKTPGDKVVYNLYAYNNGAYDAYLTNVIFNNATNGSVFKVCTAETGTSQESVDNACASIKVTVKVNTLEALETQIVTNHPLARTNSEPVTVTIEYLSTGSEADGAFTVDFGDISLVYSDMDGTVSTNDGIGDTSGSIAKACTLQDLDANGEASLSDIVTCGTEKFYVVSNDGVNLNMLSMYNLYVGNYYTTDSKVLNQLENSTNKQSELAKGAISEDTVWYGTLAFSSSAYWSSTVSSYPAYVYDSNSNLYPYVSEYERILREEFKVSSATASLISYEVVNDLITNQGNPSWLYLTSYWTGSAGEAEKVWRVYSVEKFNSIYYHIGTHIGIRPYVTISVDEINISSYGKLVTLGDQQFYVMPDHENAPEGTVSLLAKYNLDIGFINDGNGGLIKIENSTGIQSSTAIGYSDNLTEYYGVVAFSKDLYWDSNITNGTFVYNSNSRLYSYVEPYKNYLINNFGINVIEATLPSYNQLQKLGCDSDDFNCSDAPSWVYSTTYWTGSARDTNRLYFVRSSGTYGNNHYNYGYNSGVRPIIIINENDLP